MVEDIPEYKVVFPDITSGVKLSILYTDLSYLQDQLHQIDVLERYNTVLRKSSVFGLSARMKSGS